MQRFGDCGKVGSACQYWAGTALRVSLATKDISFLLFADLTPVPVCHGRWVNWNTGDHRPTKWKHKHRRKGKGELSTSSTMVSKIIIICLILRISPPLTSPISGWSIPGPRSPWVSLWDDEGWQQRTQSFKVKSADYKTVWSDWLAGHSIYFCFTSHLCVYLLTSNILHPIFVFHTSCVFLCIDFTSNLCFIIP